MGVLQNLPVRGPKAHAHLGLSFPVAAQSPFPMRVGQMVSTYHLGCFLQAIVCTHEADRLGCDRPRPSPTESVWIELTTSSVPKPISRDPHAECTQKLCMWRQRAAGVSSLHQDAVSVHMRGCCLSAGPWLAHRLAVGMYLQYIEALGTL